MKKAQTELLRNSQNSKYCVIFRNGKYLEKEIASHGTYTSYAESFDWYTIGTNKNLFSYPLESVYWPSRDVKYKVISHLLLLNYLLFLNIIYFVQNCRIIITAKYDGRFINFPPVGNINTFFFFFSKSGKEIKIYLLKKKSCSIYTIYK